MTNNLLSNEKIVVSLNRKPIVKQRLSGRLMGSVCLDDQKVNK